MDCRDPMKKVEKEKEAVPLLKESLTEKEKKVESKSNVKKCEWAARCPLCVKTGCDHVTVEETTETTKKTFLGLTTGETQTSVLTIVCRAPLANETRCSHRRKIPNDGVHHGWIFECPACNFPTCLYNVHKSLSEYHIKELRGGIFQEHCQKCNGSGMMNIPSFKRCWVCDGTGGFVQCTLCVYHEHRLHEHSLFFTSKGRPVKCEACSGTGVLQNPENVNFPCRYCLKTFTFPPK